MTCPRVLEPVDAAHLAQCVDCRAAKAAFAPLEAEAPVAPPAAALQALRHTPKVKSWVFGALAVVAGNVLVAVVAGGVAAALAGHHKDAAGWAVAALWLGVAGVGPLFAFAPGSRWAPWFGLVLGAGAALANLGTADGTNPIEVGYACFFIELFAAALPLAVSLRALTQFAFSPLRAAAVGVAAGAVGALGAHLHCPSKELSHLVGLHLAPVLVLVALAVVVRRRLPSKSFAP